MFDENSELSRLIQTIAQKLLEQQLFMATAESCTGGGIAAKLTDLPGSSQWFDRGFVTYSNDAKMDMLGVGQQMLADCGAVSEAVVRVMAEQALSRSKAGITIAVSGVAGPGGGSDDKPVGTVWFAWADTKNGCQAEKCRFSGDREQVREQTIVHALEGVEKILAKM